VAPAENAARHSFAHAAETDETNSHFRDAPLNEK